MRKNIRAQRETSREYLIKLIYQTHIINGDITDLENEMNNFLQNNEEYIINRYEELVLNYSENNIEFEGTLLDESIDRVYLNEMAKVIEQKIDYINELIENSANNWSINRFSKLDLAVIQTAIAEMLSNLNIPDKVSINEAIDFAKIYCDEKTPKFINGILGSVVDAIKTK